MSEKDKAQKSETELLREAFQGITGRLPATDRELQEWLSTPEGKAATAFLPSSGSRWGEGHS